MKYITLLKHDAVVKL